MVDFSPGSLNVTVDPYLPIASLRKKFEGKGRKLGGYILMLEGLRSNVEDHKRYSAKNPPRWKHLFMDVHANAMLFSHLPEVHPFAIFHLNYCMAYFERPINYFLSVRGFEQSIRNAKDPAYRNAKADALQEFRTRALMSREIGETKNWMDFLEHFPRPAQRRQTMMPPYTVKIPDENGQLDWIDLERAIKRNVEEMMDQGYLCISTVDVLACDTDGAYTTGMGQDNYCYTNWANYGNNAYWTQLHFAFLDCMAHWLPDGAEESYKSFRDFVHNRYGTWLESYFARDFRCEKGHGWEALLPDSIKEWMDGIRSEMIFDKAK